MKKFFENLFLNSIRKQLIIGIALVHAIMLSIFIFDLVEKEKKLLNKQQTQNSISLARTLAMNSTIWLLSNDVVGLGEVVNSIKHYPSIEYVLILNKKNQVLAHQDKKYLGKYVTDKISLKLLKATNKTQLLFENSMIIDVAYPIVWEDKIVGWARVALNKKNINEGLEKIKFDGLFYTIIAILLGIIFAYIMATGMTKSIYKIIETIKKAKVTNSNSRVNLNRIDEIGILSNEFDSMLDTIQEKNQLINSVIDSTPDLIFFKNYSHKKGVYIGCNNAFANLIGKSKEEIIGKTDFELFDEELANSYIQMDKLILENKEILKNEEWIKYPDGTKALVDTLKTPLYDRNNTLIGVIGFSRNITKRHEYQQELEKKNIIIYQQSKLASLGEMIGNIAHQWRQPLSTISTLASGIKLQKELNTADEEQINKELDDIVLTTKYLSTTIDDFRNFLLQGGTHKESVKLSEVIDQLKNIILPSLDNNFIKLLITQEDDIDIYVVKNELVQALINILNNSKDALKPLKKDEKIILLNTKKIDDKHVQITILDNGEGIHDSIIDRIFEPYFTTKHKSQGTGIGLYMVFQIITKSLDGTIEVENKEFEYEGNKYKGSKFKILLPLYKK